MPEGCEGGVGEEPYVAGSVAWGVVEVHVEHGPHAESDMLA